MTRPSHASLFTGRYPRSHGVRNNTCRLSPDLPTLAGALRDAGYVTVCAVSTGILGVRSGLQSGFVVRDTARSDQRDAAATVRSAARGCRSVAGRGKPLFLWLHLFDAHFPYAPPPGFAGAPPDDPLRHVRRINFATLSAHSDRRGGDVSRAMLERAELLYAGEISHMDRGLGAMLDSLGAMGVGGGGLITIVAADHGEGFDHGVYFDHARTIYEGGVAVPLIVRGPGVAAGRRADDLVSLSQLAPTVLGMVGIAPPPGMEEPGLLPVLRGEDRGRGRAVFCAVPEEIDAELIRTNERRRLKRATRRSAWKSVCGVPRADLEPWKDRTGVIRGGWKLVREEGRAAELYYLPDDPGEERNRIGSDPDVAARLDSIWRARARPARAPSAAAEDLDDEEIERLRALGYID